MKLFNCYHPKLVYNKYTGEQVIARCGKCPACLNARAANWVQRLDVELQQHPYNFFVTLQYDEQNVPQLIRLRKEDWKDDWPAYIDSDTGQVFCLSDCPDVTKADIDYCYNTKVLLVHDVRDFQLFIKKIRKYARKKYDARLRYYAAFEFGPTTYRSHIHSLFFIDSPLLAQDFAGLCSQAWQYGTVYDPHIISGSASQYVASYVNSFAHLPKIYLHPNIRQKALFSKTPPIGSYIFDKEILQRVFYKGLSTFTIYKESSNKFCDVPLWRCIQDRIFPRITAFNRLTHFERIILYRFGNHPYFRFRYYKGIIKLMRKPYWLPYFHIAFFTPDRFKVYTLNMDSLAKFVRVVCRVCDNAREFGTTIKDYVSKIETFYEEKQKSDLKDYYHLQDAYFKEHPISDFLLFNPNFYISVKNKCYKDLEKWQRFYLDMYLPGKFSDEDIINFNYIDAFCYRELRGLHNKIFFDSTKRKKSNDYLESNRDKFDNIITYNQEIENYVESEII